MHILEESYSISPIAHIRCDLKTKFGVPRQSGIVPTLSGTVVFEPEYRVRESLRGMEGFSHIWLIWSFSEARRAGFSPTVRPPRLGGNERMGVFATRSPFRPNSLALSCVRLCALRETASEGIVLDIAGADLMDGTPIYDIKPYLPFADSYPDARGGFAAERFGHALTVQIADELLERIPETRREAALALLEQDPRPSYQNDPERIYGLRYAGLELRFRVAGDVLTVVEVEADGAQSSSADCVGP